MDKVEGRGVRDLVEVLKRAIPSNIFAAALEVQLLALVFVGVVFGYFMSRLNGPAGRHSTAVLGRPARPHDSDYDVDHAVCSHRRVCAW